MTLEEIKAEIEKLSELKRCELNAWMRGWEMDAWDLQMQADAASGKLDALWREAEAELLEGKCKSLPWKA